MIAEAVKHMLAAGMPHAAILAAIADMEACITPARSKGADRQARYEERKRQKASESVRDDYRASPEVSPNDIYSNPHPNPSTPDAAAPRPSICGKVVEAWNAGPAKAGATPAKPLDDGRRKALSLRLREHSEAEVFEAIANLGRSPWHCGKGEKGWKANIGWILKSPENFQKALEMGGSANSDPPADFASHLAAKYRNAA
jgi:hypothetical protein